MAITRAPIFSRDMRGRVGPVRPAPNQRVGVFGANRSNQGSRVSPGMQAQNAIQGAIQGGNRPAAFTRAGALEEMNRQVQAMSQRLSGSQGRVNPVTATPAGAPAATRTPQEVLQGYQSTYTSPVTRDNIRAAQTAAMQGTYGQVAAQQGTRPNVFTTVPSTTGRASPNVAVQQYIQSKGNAPADLTSMEDTLRRQYANVRRDVRAPYPRSYAPRRRGM